MNTLERDLDIKHKDINPIQQGIRVGLKEGFSILFPTTVLHEERVDEAEKFLRDGNGLVIVANHFSKRETMEIYRIPFTSPEMRKRHILTPVAEHQKKWYLTFLNALAHAKLQYIPTKETEKQYAEVGKTVEEEQRKMREYANNLTETLEHGDISLIFPQAHRKSSLYDDENPKVLSSIHRVMMAEARRKAKANGEEVKEPNYGVMFLGFDGPEGIPYKILRNKTNKGFTYTINVGRTYSIQELLTRAGGDPRRLDEIIFAELEKYISPKYLGEGPLQMDSDFPERLPSHTFDQELAAEEKVLFQI